ncbi:DNA cytosine methyltransferase [Vibrio sp. 10N.261.45.A4]|uniref:DNA cytosine methyltransferase n=1 Tax=Vibrio sp. 10N.261.45.A4 TaxID=3229655 RepID=UPI003550688B
MDILAVTTLKANEIRSCEYSYLREVDGDLSSTITTSGDIRIVDLFAGCGGISLGAVEAIRANGLTCTIAAAVEWEQPAADCFQANLSPEKMFCQDLNDLINGDLGQEKTQEEVSFHEVCGDIDLLVGGPPCQGHSDLNNYSRREDPKNSLYLKMARAAEVLSPKWILIENVVGAVNDKGQVVQETIVSLQSQGYEVETGIVDCFRIGVAQKRRRFILLASKVGKVPTIANIHEKYEADNRDLAWAIKDLEGKAHGGSILNQPSSPSKDNIARMKYMFDNELYDLPNEQRPACHRNKPHSYNSIYGRLKWSDAAQTLTSGFYSTSMGRYVHPSEVRTLTAHEAARIQGFPDFYLFEQAKKRTALAKILGNAVPPKLSYACVKELLDV